MHGGRAGPAQALGGRGCSEGAAQEAGAGGSRHSRDGQGAGAAAPPAAEGPRRALGRGLRAPAGRAAAGATSAAGTGGGVKSERSPGGPSKP